jgi:hypothetical protein
MQKNRQRNINEIDTNTYSWRERKEKETDIQPDIERQTNRNIKTYN